MADYFIRKGAFEKARDVYEEGVESAMTVRDFSIIFDAYSQYEESMLNAKMEMLEADDEEAEEDDLGEDGDDIEMRMARFEQLMERRPILLSSVLLRQNPNNVHEWNKRSKLFSDPVKVIDCFSTAVSTVDPQKANGKLEILWGKAMSILFRCRVSIH